MPDDLIVNIFDNIENRLQYIEPYVYCIIIRRVSDNTLFKSEINYEEEDDDQGNNINAN